MSLLLALRTAPSAEGAHIIVQRSGIDCADAQEDGVRHPELLLALRTGTEDDGTAA